ncbi:homoserine dehydrogenase [Virgibacillus subterraneus]|uniref:Homoserine dehydrogenase n=1 Tax=Virgibacillus subterraneus TaxID=621109 RepID=A0A1H9B4E7_9BACI|nr:homoserine dehydrogenase [Virgibacillus subterraneus]SEP83896.1 homoserine dehydrogenase [Virgibacillus subterraneus]
MEKNISVGLLGLGTVGSGVVQIVEGHQEELVHQLGCGVTIKSILVCDVEKDRNVQVNPATLTTNPEAVLADPEIDIIIEVMGGIDEAREHILRAFKAKKHVVTANKDLMALHGPELQYAAKQNGCDLFYEASVAGGIPIIGGIVDGLASDRIEKVMGIVNGTTNYILTKMDDEGVAYEDALKEAQELGFAEADPTGDVGGLDAARKMAILARLAFSTSVDLADVEVDGIEGLALEDLLFGRQLGLKMKLIGFADFQDKQIEVSVQPTFLPENHPLAAVKNEYNAVYVNGKAVGETMFYGPGAGSLPTATAVMSDVTAVIKNMLLGVTGQQVVTPRYDKVLKSPEQRFGQYYFRIHVQDRSGTFTEISSLFNELDISFERILQDPIKNDKENGLAEVIVVTHQTTLEKINQALEKLAKVDVVEEVKSYFRIEGGYDQ